LGYSFVLGTVIVNYVIVIHYVGNVLCAIDNRHVLLRRNDEFPVRWSGKISDANESEGGRPDIIITVAPGMNANVDRYRGFGWQVCPADVIIIVRMTPGYPRRRPRVPRDPDPSGSGDANPAAVVIGSPAEIFIRDPAPSAIGPDPVTVRVGLP